MTIIEAILEVMREAGAPMGPQDAYRRILEKNLYRFKAQNPQSVVTGQIRRHCVGLEFPTAEQTKYFMLETDGRFAPLPSPIRGAGPGRRPTKSKKLSVPVTVPGGGAPRSLTSTYSEIQALQVTYKDLLKARILRDLKTLTPGAFEHFGKKLLDAYGFEGLQVTSISNDGGIDGFGKLKVGLAYMRVAFQCKRWTKTNVGRPEIDRFRGAIQGEYEQGIFFTTAHFVPAALGASIRPGAVPVILVDGPGIVDLMIEKHLGVEEESIPIYTYALDTILQDEGGESGR